MDYDTKKCTISIFNNVLINSNMLKNQQLMSQFDLMEIFCVFKEVCSGKRSNPNLKIIILTFFKNIFGDVELEYVPQFGQIVKMLIPLIFNEVCHNKGNLGYLELLTDLFVSIDVKCGILSEQTKERHLLVCYIVNSQQIFDTVIELADLIGFQNSGFMAELIERCKVILKQNRLFN